MSYEKQTWTDGVSPLNAERMSHMEDGIATAHDDIKALQESGGISGGVVAEGSGVLVELELEEGQKIAVSGEATEAVNLYHCGKNLLPAYTGDDTTKNNVTITKRANGRVSISGVPSTTTYFDVATKTAPFYLPAGDYTMIPDGFPATGSLLTLTLSAVDGSVTKSVTVQGGVNKFNVPTGGNFTALLIARPAYTGEEYTIGIMLVAESVESCDYEAPNINVVSATLPAEVEAYEGTNTLYTDSGDTLNAVVEETLADLVASAVKKIVALDPSPYGLPVLELTGDISAMDKDNAVDLAYVFGDLTGTASVKWQGSSSLNYPKKNYTVKFDQEFEAVEGWGAQKKYCMKANYIDFSHSRNVCGAKLWGEVVASRATENTNLAACPNYGAVDGFPICIVVNGEYMGVYTFNIPKDGWMANMGSGTQEAILCADLNSEADAFKAEAVVGGNYSDFELEYTTDETNTDWIQTSLNALINACINSDGTDLDTTIATMLDWDSAIDYYIFCALTNNYDGIQKNYLLFTYDGTKWLFSAYDLDSIFGGFANGKQWWNAKDGMTLTHLKGRHRVFELIYTYKMDALKARAEELMSGVLSEDNVQYVVRNFATNIPRQMLDEDNRVWPTLPGTLISNTHQILDWYRLRFARIKAELDAM